MASERGANAAGGGRRASLFRQAGLRRLLWNAGIAAVAALPARAVDGGAPVRGTVNPPPAPETVRITSLAPPTPPGLPAPKRLPAGSGGRVHLGADAAGHPLSLPSRTLLAGESAKSGARPQIEIVSVAETPNATFVRGVQTVAGRPVLGSRLAVVWHASGRPVLLRAGTYRETHEAWPARAWPAEELEAAALRDLPHAATEWEAREEAWLPAIGVDGQMELLPVCVLRFRTEGPDGRWEARVHAGTKALLSRQSLLVFGTINGTVRAVVEPAVPGDTTVLVPVDAAAVTAVSGQYFGADTTSATGAYTISIDAEGRARVTAELRGRHAWVRDAGRGLFTPLDTVTVSMPGNADLTFDDENSTPALRDAYYHLLRAYHFTRNLDPGPALARLDRAMEARVDDPSGGCNAYWNGSRLNFYAAGGGCTATARIADVVYHEYGHAVTQSCYAPWEPPGDMNEAFSDYFAATLTGQPRIGNGFFGPGTFLRDVERDRVWPDDANPSIHLQGLILAGALWDLRREVGADLADSLFHFARYGAAGSFDDYLLDLLAVDDDDGDLGNGTPHFGPIIRAFRAHGIGDYAVHITHRALPDLEDPGPWIEARAAIRSLLALAPDSVSFFYATEDSFTRVDPRPTGSSREYAALIPAPEPGTRVRYYWAAADTAGHAARLPIAAPDSTYQFFVGADTVPPVIAHESVEAVTEDVARVTLRATLTDNSDRVGPAYAQVWGGPDSAVVAPFTWIGGSEYRTEIALPLGGGDSLAYRLEAADAAVRPNLTTWPPDGSEQLLIRPGRTLTFEDSPGGLSADAGWEWGAPPAPLQAWSGARVWGTGLVDGYADNASWSLAWGPIDLGGWERGRLEFRHWYRCERGYDGGLVEWAAQPEGPWFALEPSGGYPVPRVRAVDGPAFSGESDGWTRERFALDGLLGQVVWFRFRFESDAGVRDQGWLLDDVTVIAAQARAIPAALRAQECGASCVQLRWQPPPGVDTAAVRFRGYEIRRAEGDGSFTTDPIHPFPRRSVAYVDTGLTTGTSYRYRVNALYDEGPGPARIATATPAAPALDLELTEIVYNLRAATSSDTSFLVGNRSGGVLRLNAYLGEAEQPIDSVRLAYPWPDGDAPWSQVWSDATDPGSVADLAGIDLRARNDLETGPVLEIRLRGHVPWPAPSAWGGLVLIDTDDNLSTGLLEPNLGADFLVAFGSLAQEAGHEGPAVLLDTSFRPVSALTGASITEGTQPVLLAVPRAHLGTPASVRVAVRLATTLQGEAYDRAPETPPLPWLSREPRHGRATPGHPQPVAVNFDASTVGNGTWRARLFVETNDESDPVRVIPVTLQVSGLTPEDVLDLRFDSLDRGLSVSFVLPADLAVDGVVVERSDADPIRWGTRTPVPILPDSSRAVRFLDDTVEPGRAYLYRFRVGYASSDLVVYGPYPATYAPAIPTALRLYPPRPNPFRASGSRVELRLDLPAPGSTRLEVFDPAGRRVHVLLDADLPAGTRYASWSGRTENGHALAAGSYWIRLVTARGERSTRLVVVR